MTFRNGKKAEITNTDAEGRVVLADAIARAAEDAPDVLLETSTLTGAQLVALGNRTAGVMGSEDLPRRRRRRRRRVGEGMWPMPLPAELRRGLDSPVADFVNSTADRLGGMLVGGTSSPSSCPTGCRGRTSTSPGRATTPARRGATRPRAAPASRCAPCSPPSRPSSPS